VEIKFTKAEAGGNDFIIIDSENLSPEVNLSELTQALCLRKKSIGADGLLIYDKSELCDFKMRIFNPDGQEVNMCGNGARCLALYALKKKLTKEAFKIETRAGIIEADMTGSSPKLKLTDPKDIKLNLTLKLKEGEIKVHFVDTGVPHVVCLVKDLDDFDVLEIGRQIRYHKSFEPEGTNANFIQLQDDKGLKIRTYERGVEDETLACGTGAAAGALIASKVKNLTSPVDLKVKSGQLLRIYFDRKDECFKNVYLEGECNIVFEGNYLLKEGKGISYV
jgi:diaminopimelate epimerase